MLRRLALLVAALTLALSATAVAAPAPATAPAAGSSFKAKFTPVNSSLRALGKEIAVAVQKAETKTDAQLATQFARLAGRTTKAAAAVAAVQGAPANVRGLQIRLATSLVRTAGDLAGIATAASGHDAKAARAAAGKLGTHYNEVGTARRALAKRLGLS